MTPSRHPTCLHPSSFPHPHSLARSEDGWEWLGLWWHWWQELSDRFCWSGGHEGNGPWPRGWDLSPLPPARCWPESRTPAVAATRGFRRLAAQDVSSLGPYLVKVFRDSVIRLQGGGGPGSVPGERARCRPGVPEKCIPAAHAGVLTPRKTPGLAESRVGSASIPGRTPESPIQACAAGEAGGTGRCKDYVSFPVHPTVDSFSRRGCKWPLCARPPVYAQEPGSRDSA